MSRYQRGLPAWLVNHICHYQRLQQVRWRPARLAQQIKQFWHTHTTIFRWLTEHYPFEQPAAIKRRHILTYIDHRLEAGLSVSTINCEVRSFQAVLRYLQEQEYLVPQVLLRLPGLKDGERLPRFLTDEQVIRLRTALEQQLVHAQSDPGQRDALLQRAAFYLLWQGGLRLGEVEELRLDDLDLANYRLIVRQGKGRRDRTVFLTERATLALHHYLLRRGPGYSAHVFLYRTRPLSKDLLRERLKAVGQRVGVKVSPHQLRHTFAT